jgi:hypothetical protein
MMGPSLTSHSFFQTQLYFMIPDSSPSSAQTNSWKVFVTNSPVLVFLLFLHTRHMPWLQSESVTSGSRVLPVHPEICHQALCPFPCSFTWHIPMGPELFGSSWELLHGFWSQWIMYFLGSLKTNCTHFIVAFVWFPGKKKECCCLTIIVTSQTNDIYFQMGEVRPLRRVIRTVPLLSDNNTLTQISSALFLLHDYK